MIDLGKELIECFQISDAVLEDPTGASVSVQLALPENLTYFKGHFPGFSVLPAMGLVDVSQFLVTQKSGKKNKLQQIKRAKMKRPLGPNQKVHISLQIQNGTSPNQPAECSATWSDPTDNSVIADIQFAVTF